jgi:serine/threonine protein phosphatase PrpC
MGCGAVSKPVQQMAPIIVQSNTATNHQRASSSKSTVHKNFVHILNDQCPMVRLDHPPQPKVLEVFGENFTYFLQYVYVSQRGYYPNALGKANQDSYTVCESLMGDKSCNFFGIFDGHGEYGDYCSHYCADNLPSQLVSEIEKNGGLEVALGNGNKMQDAYVRSFLNTNFGLHSSKIDDSLSGTTGITIIQKGDRLFIANVGDSRAIIASDVDGKLVYSPLSSDQTPYRKDERDRLKKAVSFSLIDIWF